MPPGGPVPRVGEHDIAALLELQSTLEAGQLHLAPDVFCALPPLQLEDFNTQLADDIFGHPELRILNVGLDDNAPFSVIPASEGIDPALHFRGLLDLPVLEFSLRVHAANVFSGNHDHTGDGGAHRHIFPVNPRDVGRADRAGKNRKIHLYGPIRSKARRAVTSGNKALSESASIPTGAHTGSLNVKMREIDRIIFFGPRGYLAERLGVDHLPPLERGAAYFAGPLAAVKTSDAHA